MANADERTPLQAVQSPADRAEAMRKKRLAIGFLAAAALLLGAVTALLWHRANPHYIDMVDNAYNVTFVNATQLTAMRTAAPECARRMQAAGNNVTELLDAESFCDVNLDMPMDVAKRNVYDIREVCDKDPVSDCVPSGHILQYLERPGVRELLNVSKQANTWQMVNLEVNMAFRVSGDMEISYSSYEEFNAAKERAYITAAGVNAGVAL
ncbi:hypothetical protein PybrP1_013047 [[Pythium] brassicae (nom. inval.)]|nr:hypothetical protein PybrP1_013047 [[Pythium] brassicae (nom. inval.)]